MPPEQYYQSPNVMGDFDRYSDPLGLHTITKEDLVAKKDITIRAQFPGLLGDDADGEEVLLSIPTPADFAVEEAVAAKAIQAETDAKLKLLEAYGEDVYEDGTVFTFERQFKPGGGKLYQYAVIRSRGKWYVTGSKHGGQDWYELVSWLIRGVSATGWTRMIADVGEQPEDQWAAARRFPRDESDTPLRRVKDEPQV